MPPSSPQVRDAAPDDLDAVLDVRTRAFGAAGEAFREPWYDTQRQMIAARRALVISDGDRVLAYARALPMHQWWGGRTLPMANPSWPEDVTIGDLTKVGGPCRWPASRGWWWRPSSAGAASARC